MNQNKGLWIWAVIAVIIIALGVWWIASNQSTDNGAMATSTTQGKTAPVIPITNRSSSSVLSIAQSIAGASTFASWLNSTGVAAQIQGKGPYTVFVPTDGSIGQLPAGTFSNLSAAEKKRFVQYHVVSGRAIDVTAELAGSITALSKDMLNFSYGNQKLPLVNSSIVITEYKASNGIVYLIDNPLIPPKKTQ